MNQRLIARKELLAITIHHYIVVTLGPEAVCYSSVTRDLHEAIFVSSNSPATIPEAEPPFDDCDHSILLALAEQPSASIRELGRLTHLPQTTVHRRLTRSLGFISVILEGFPFFVTLSKTGSRDILTTAFVCVRATRTTILAYRGGSR
jgi:hypothetical protein